ncbi:cupin domain-containing protein [Novosphingobium sp. 9]|uniref:cupin domain-containing protein n=1 Tax=Novosphingobium sp. 9 TaxID=2025349 RepID=UPI0021B6B45D|nr:cupin domain-containing protein [Novosphingobium sp. 9]
MWEMHPDGDELVVCLSGAFTLWQASPEGGQRRIELEPGQYAINPAGVWHTANTRGPAEALFVTSGQGTQHRRRH